MSRTRKNYTPEQKGAILKRHLVEKLSVSDLCDELGLSPTVFHALRKQFVENRATASGCYVLTAARKKGGRGRFAGAA